MSDGLLDIRKRIKSVKNTRQVTKAMEAVAASKMRKAVDRAQKAKEYAKLARELIANIARSGTLTHHVLVEPKEGKRTLLLLITSDRGLCGAYNAQIMKAVFDFLAERGRENVDIVSVGKKGQTMLARFGYECLAVFPLLDRPDIQKTLPVSQFLEEKYMEGMYEKISIAFMDFRSTVKQNPVIQQVLPLTGEIESVAGPIDESGLKKYTPQIPPAARETEYLFEPNQETILNRVIPRLYEAQILQTFLEASASEHLSRMVAMRNATDNAGDMIHDLTLTYNQARQSAITQEIAEISAGKAALA